MDFLHPGVYIQEVSSGVKPIEGVSTSTAAFIGKAEKGPLDRAVMVTSLTEFQSLYGGFLNDSYLAHAALHFFNNGGQRLYVARVAKGAMTAAVSLKDRQSPARKTLTCVANSAGEWGNALDVEIADATRDPDNEFRLIVRRAGQVLEVHDNLSMDAVAGNFVENVLTASSRVLRVTVSLANVSGQSGTSLSGASAAISLAEKRKLLINVDGDGPQVIEFANPLTSGKDIAAALQTAVRSLTPVRSTNKKAFTDFTADFTNGVYTLRSGSTGSRSSVEVLNAPNAAENAALLLKLGKRGGGKEVTGAAALRPVSGTYNIGDNSLTDSIADVTLGADGGTPQDADYINGFALLDDVLDVNLIAVPGIGSIPVASEGMEYCQGRLDCFFLADMSVITDTKEEAIAFVDAMTKTSYGAVYFPWLRMIDPTGVAPEPIAVPPSGFVAGLYARIDARRGVWKAPAGTEANVSGAVGLLKNLSDAEQGTLNQRRVNAIRQFPAAGIVVWGARTLASDPEYRYVPVRRMAIFLEQSLFQGIQWAVFEPNDEPLWASLRLNITAFMLRQFRAGAFQGRTASEAFFVKCDNQTTTQADIDAGVVNILVGFAPLKPAEFIVLRLTQKVGQSTT